MWTSLLRVHRKSFLVNILLIRVFVSLIYTAHTRQVGSLKVHISALLFTLKESQYFGQSIYFRESFFVFVFCAHPPATPCTVLTSVKSVSHMCVGVVGVGVGAGVQSAHPNIGSLIHCTVFWNKM